jgi:hypothetical protein
VKNKRIKFAVLPLIALPLLLSGCFNAFQPTKASPGTGLVQISLAAPGATAPGATASNVAARTAMPLASSLYYTLTFTGLTTVSVDLDRELAAAVPLAPGEWTLDVKGYPDDSRTLNTHIAEGSASLSVEASKTTVTIVPLDYTEVSPGGTGSISYRIQFPANTAFGTLRIKKYGGSVYKTIDLLSGDYNATTNPEGNNYVTGAAFGTLDNVPGGYYEALIRLYDTQYTAHTELVHVYNRSTTPVQHIFLSTDSSATSSGVRYVTTSGGNGNGSSWSTASGDLQKMMDELAALRATASQSGDTGSYVVKVAGGTYKPQHYPMIPTDPANIATYTYTAGSRDSAFMLRPGVEVWGGYDSSDGKRDIQANTTTLSGDLNGDDISNLKTDNAYHVVLAVDLGSETVLDGLTISGGNADGGNVAIVVGGANISRDSGGGMYNDSASTTLNNVMISGNYAGEYGGGLYNDASSPALTNASIDNNTSANNGGGMYNAYNSMPVLENVIVTKNEADANGGGIFNGGSSPTLINVTITSNTANKGDAPSGAGGGGIFNSGLSPVLINVTISGNKSLNIYGFGGGMVNDNSSPVLTNVAITGNSAVYYGGGIYNNTSSPVLTNVTIAGNKTNDQGGGIHNHNSNPQIRNSIIWGNVAGAIPTPSGISNSNSNSTPVVSYSIVEGGNAGTNNLSSDPLFTNPESATSAPTTSGTYSLRPYSPGIDTGSAGYYAPGLTPDLSNITTDLNNTTRIQGDAIDRGAYEKSTQPI